MTTIGVVCVGILIQQKMLLLKRVHFAVEIATAKHACGWTHPLKSVSPFLTFHELVVFCSDVIIIFLMFVMADKLFISCCRI